MKDTPTDACGITLDSLMSLTHQERLDMIQAYREAAWVCHIVLMMSNTPPMPPAEFKNTIVRYAHGNKVAARIALDYLTLGKDVKLPAVPPEWYLTIERTQNAQPT